MRKKPPGKLLSRTAHQVDREYRIIHSLETTDVPVPKAYCLCEDTSIVGTAFYIMECLDGRFITEPVFPDADPEERTLMYVHHLQSRIHCLQRPHSLTFWLRWKSAVETLAAFHRVDYKDPTINMSSFGRHANFYDRQIKTFSTLSPDQAKAVDVETKIPVGPIPHVDKMLKFFKDKSRQPKDRSTLIHGDYKIDNMVFHKTEPRVIGILDWEMATIGHPLSDLVNLTGPWAWTSSTNTSPKADNEDFKPGKTPGLPTLEQVVQWYSDASGYDAAGDLAWGNAFGAFRTSVIMQGIAARYAVRQASGLTAKNYAAQMKPYGEWAWTQVEEVRRRQEEEKNGGRSLAKL